MIAACTRRVPTHCLLPASFIAACIRRRPMPRFCATGSTEIGPIPAIGDRKSTKLQPRTFPLSSAATPKNFGWAISLSIGDGIGRPRLPAMLPVRCSARSCAGPWRPVGGARAIELWLNAWPAGGFRWVDRRRRLSEIHHPCKGACGSVLHLSLVAVARHARQVQQLRSRAQLPRQRFGSAEVVRERKRCLSFTIGRQAMVHRGCRRKRSCSAYSRLSDIVGKR
jgi:hypothetical protein